MAVEDRGGYEVDEERQVPFLCIVCGAMIMHDSISLRCNYCWQFRERSIQMCPFCENWVLEFDWDCFEFCFRCGTFVEFIEAATAE